MQHWCYKSLVWSSSIVPGLQNIRPEWQILVVFELVEAENQGLLSRKWGATNFVQPVDVDHILVNFDHALFLHLLLLTYSMVYSVYIWIVSIELGLA